MSKKIIWIGTAVIVGLLGILGVLFLQPTETTNPQVPMQKVQVVAPTKSQIATFSYAGKEGVDALTVMKEKTGVEQAASGLVISINGRKADDKKHEFWAFYVNGKFAEVGPADYITKDGDKIEWKIDHY